MKLAILGGGNCYAMNLARMALDEGHRVMGIGRSPLKGEPFSFGLEGYDYHVYSVGPDTEFILEALYKFTPDVIVNFAAQGEGQASFRTQHWKYFYRTNTQALVELTEKIHAAGWYLRKFIQIGTSELYGSVEKPAAEDSPLRPSSPYAVSKAAFDLHLVSIAKTCAFPALIVRPSNAYCEGQQLHRIIPKALIYGLTDRKIPLQGGGQARKSYIHADDLSRAILLLANKGEVGEVYNCGPQEPTSIKRLVELCAQCLGKKPDELYEIAPDRVGQDGCYWLDSSKLRAFGWMPQVPLLGGIARMHEWLLKYPELLGFPTDYRLRA